MPDKIPHLKPAFREGGTVTAANSSADLRRRSRAGPHAPVESGKARPQAARDHRGARELRPPARALSHRAHRRDARLAERTGWSLADVDLFEINEAFAVVAMAAMRDLSLPHEKVNIHGGACALGHPIGASGARIIVTLLAALQKYHLRRGIASLCIGGGEATAVAIEMIPE